MTYEQHIDNWIAYLESMQDSPTGLEHVSHCRSIEHQYPSAKNAGFGNADVGELPYDVQVLQSRRPIVVDQSAAELFDSYVLKLSKDCILWMRWRYVPWSIKNSLDRLRANFWSQHTKQRLREQARADMTRMLNKTGLL